MPGMGHMGPPPMGGGREAAVKDARQPKPKNLKEIPGFIKGITGKFFYRLLYIFSLVWKTKPPILIALVLIAVINGVLPVIQAVIAADILDVLARAYRDSAASTDTFQEVLRLLVLQFVCIFVRSLVGSINTIVTQISNELVANHVNVEIMEKAKTIDMASFDRPEFYQKLENASREAGNRPIQIINSTCNVFSTLISMVSFIVILWAVNPIAPFIIIALSIPSAIISFHYRKKNFNYMFLHSKARRQLQYYNTLMTDKDMAKEVRMYNLSDLFIGRYKSIFKEYFKGIRSLFNREGLCNSLMAIVTSIVNCLLFVYIAREVCEGRLSVGDFSLYTGALNTVASGINTIIALTAIIYEGTLFIDNMVTYMNEKTMVVPTLAKPVKVERRKGHRIEFEHVSFSYPGTKRDVIHDVSLVMEPGETIVLVGLNGAGKTTLIKLLTRLYDPTEGRILLDGRDIREYDLTELRAIFGIIFQDFGKYAVSVKENISFGEVEREAKLEDIKYAAGQSGSTQFIDQLPAGYDTPLMRYFEENGIELSIGQWQKLSVARAFYRNSDILILDEPTAALDAIAEQEIYDQFDSLRRNKTTIFVSHRLSSATVADKIIVLDRGCVIEEGNHKQLMEKQGEYYRLFSTQAKRYISEEY